MSDTEEAALRADALKFIDRYLSDALNAASSEGANPAVALYALLECAMNVAQAHFPEHAGQLYASATQMVYEVHDSGSADAS